MIDTGASQAEAARRPATPRQLHGSASAGALLPPTASARCPPRRAEQEPRRVHRRPRGQGLEQVWAGGTTGNMRRDSRKSRTLRHAAVRCAARTHTAPLRPDGRRLCVPPAALGRKCPSALPRPRLLGCCCAACRACPTCTNPVPGNHTPIIKPNPGTPAYFDFSGGQPSQQAALCCAVPCCAPRLALSRGRCAAAPDPAPTRSLPLGSGCMRARAAWLGPAVHRSGLQCRACVRRGSRPRLRAAARCADTSGHGTHVAGILAAATNNSRGVAGMSWQASAALRGLLCCLTCAHWSPHTPCCGTRLGTHQGGAAVPECLPAFPGCLLARSLPTTQACRTPSAPRLLASSPPRPHGRHLCTSAPSSPPTATSTPPPCWTATPCARRCAPWQPRPRPRRLTRALCRRRVPLQAQAPPQSGRRALPGPLPRLSCCVQRDLCRLAAG